MSKNELEEGRWGNLAWPHTLVPGGTQKGVVMPGLGSEEYGIQLLLYNGMTYCESSLFHICNKFLLEHDSNCLIALNTA